VCVQAIRFARVCVEEAMRYSFKRKTFGKALIEVSFHSFTLLVAYLLLMPYPALALPLSHPTTG